MKKTFFLLLLLIMLLPLAADDNGSKSETLRLSLTVRNVVYVGVTDSKVSSSIVPTNNLGIIRFTFDPYNKIWRTNSAYLYVISFISDKVTVTLTPGHLKNGADNDNTIPYTAKATKMTSNSDCKTLSISSKGSSFTGLDPVTDKDGNIVTDNDGNIKTYDYGTLVSESGVTRTVTDENGKVTTTTYNYTNPRVMSWEFLMEIDASSVTPVASQYTATFTMTITASE